MDKFVEWVKSNSKGGVAAPSAIYQYVKWLEGKLEDAKSGVKLVVENSSGVAHGLATKVMEELNA